jgi:hypothetical protein
VAPLWDDLNPAVGGSVTRRQLGDRIAITWQNVPEYSTSNQNTFQVELFFSGLIRLSYGSVAATDGLTGISAGLGQDPSFFELDLSSAQGCGGDPAARPAPAPGHTVEVSTQ